MAWIVPEPPSSIDGCRVYQRLKAEGSADLIQRVERVCKHAGELLDRVGMNLFKRFTLHDAAHAVRLTHLAEFVMSEGTLEQLSPLECAIIIQAAHIHDLGMAVSEKEVAAARRSPEFLQLFRGQPRLWERHEQLKNLLVELPPAEQSEIPKAMTRIEDIVLAEYFRRKHAQPERYRELLARMKGFEGDEGLFAVDGLDYEDELIEVCASHNLDAKALRDTSRFDPARTHARQHFNMQFCAAVLRITDILDFDRERVPPLTYEHLDLDGDDHPAARESRWHWKSRQAIHTLSFSPSQIAPDELIVSAVSDSPELETAIWRVCREVEDELRATSQALGKKTGKNDRVYQLNFPLAVQVKVKPRGYLQHKLSISLNQSSMRKLLMGQNLYSRPEAGIRELIQNSIDAYRLRLALRPADCPVPQITVNVSPAERPVSIEVSDNGLGMDNNVISHYLLNIGSSYHDSAHLAELLSACEAEPFHHISKFGIGILAPFLIAERMEIDTKPGPPLKPFGDADSKRIVIHADRAPALVHEGTRGDVGTSVRLHLRPEFRSQEAVKLLGQALHKAMLRPPVPINVTLGEGVEFTTQEGSFASCRPEGVEVLRGRKIEVVELEVDSRISSVLRGRVFVFLARLGSGLLCLSPSTGTSLRWGRPPLHDEQDLQEKLFGQTRLANTLTVDGFRMGHRKLARDLIHQERRLLLRFDLDVSDVEYDLAREKITNHAADALRDELRKSLVLGLEREGLLEQLSDAALRVLRPDADTK